MKIVIAGAGAVGTHLSKLLSRDHQDCVLIDADASRLAGLDGRYDIMTIQGSPTSIKILEDAGTGTADLFVGVTPDESKNMNACSIAHALGAKKTVARIDNYEYLAPHLKPFFEKMGINSLIYPEVLAAIDITNGLKMSWVRQRWDVHDGALVMLGIKLRNTCEILNEPLKNLCGPDDPYHIVAIKRNGETLIPGGNDKLCVNDLAYFMTTSEYIPYIRKISGKEHYADVKNVIIMGGGKTAVRVGLTLPDYMDLKIIEKSERRCEQLNELLGVRKTVAMVENLDYVEMAESLDIGTIINKKTVAASHIYQMMLDADVSNVRSLMMVDSDVAEFVAAEGSKVTKKPVKDLGLPFGVTIGGLVRNNEGILVNGNTQILPGDSVMVFCHEQNLKKIEKYFKSNTLW